jgi:phospholipid transport system substrate-binding protein
MMSAERSHVPLRRAPPPWCSARSRVPRSAQEAPDALVKRVSEEVLADRQDRSARCRRATATRIREVIDTKLAPHFDFERMTALGVGRGWRQATPEQQKQLVDAVPHRSLRAPTRTRSCNTATRRSLQAAARRPGATDVTVRTESHRRRPARCRSTTRSDQEGHEWKAYDVIVGGVSLVTNYRDEFNAQIQAAASTASSSRCGARTPAARRRAAPRQSAEAERPTSQPARVRTRGWRFEARSTSRTRRRHARAPMRCRCPSSGRRGPARLSRTPIRRASRSDGAARARAPRGRAFASRTCPPRCTRLRRVRRRRPRARHA